LRGIKKEREQKMQEDNGETGKHITWQKKQKTKNRELRCGSVFDVSSGKILWTGGATEIRKRAHH